MTQEAREKMVILLKTPPVRRTKGYPAEVDIERLADQILALEDEDWKLKVMGKPVGLTNKDGAEVFRKGYEFPPNGFIFFMPFDEWGKDKEVEK